MVDYEKTVLGSALLSRRSLELVTESLKEEDFETIQHKSIFKALKNLSDRGLDANSVTIYTELKKLDLLTEAGGASYVAELTRETFSDATVEYTIRLLKERRARIKLKEVANGIIISADDEKTDVLSLIENYSRALEEIVGNTVGTAKKDNLLYDMLEDFFKDLKKERDDPQSSGIILKQLPTFNKVVGGLMPGDLVGIYGREKSTKTTLAYSMLLDVAFQEIPVGIFSYEIAVKELIQKAISQSIGVDWLKLRNPSGYNEESKLTDEELKDIMLKSSRKFHNTKILLEDSILDEQEIYYITKQWVRRYGVRLIVIDYLMLLPCSKHFGVTRERLNYLSAFFKQMARKLGVVIVLVSQANETGERGAEAKGLERDSNYFIYVAAGSVGDSFQTYLPQLGEVSIPIERGDYIALVRGIRHTVGNRYFVMRFQDHRYVEADLQSRVSKYL